MRPEILEIIKDFVAGVKYMNLACKKFGDLYDADAEALGADGLEAWSTIAVNMLGMLPACKWAEKQTDGERQDMA